MLERYGAVSVGLWRPRRLRTNVRSTRPARLSRLFIPYIPDVLRMDELQARILVKRLEQEAAARPLAYRLRVACLALLGYGYFAMLAAFSIAILYASYIEGEIIRGTIPALLILVLLLSAFWIRLAPPLGVPLRRSEAPDLWAAIDQIRVQLRAPKIHEIRISDKHNAAIAQIPRLGIFGWYKNYLVLGFPLLQSLSRDQALAVIGHELGHLSRNHGRFAGWIYRLRIAWSRLHAIFVNEPHSRWYVLFVPFINRYAPYFEAYSFVLARADEYIADQCAAQVTDHEAVRSGLVRLASVSRFAHETFLSSMTPHLKNEPEPPGDIPTRLAAYLQEHATQERLARYRVNAAAERTGWSDTHPSLTDRLRGLGWKEVPEPSWCAPPQPGADAATVLLSHTTIGRVLARLGDHWRSTYRDFWKTTHHRVMMIQEDLSALEARAATEMLPRAEAWSRIRLTHQLDPNRAYPMLLPFIAAHPDHAEARLYFGRHLADLGDDAGIDHLRKASQLDEDLLVPAYRLIAAALSSKGRRQEALSFERTAEDRATILEAADLERRTMSRKDGSRAGHSPRRDHCSSADGGSAIPRCNSSISGPAAG